MHEAAAQQIAQRIRVVGEHHLHHFRLRLLHRPRHQMAIALAHAHADDSIKRVHIHHLAGRSAIRCVLMGETSRVEMLTQFLKENPNDSFARYGLAMEYSKSGDSERAMQEFAKLLET